MQHTQIVIEPGRPERHYWLELWHYRELFRALASRDLSVRYKQTVLGVTWALVRPAIAMVVFTVIFGRIAKLPSDGAAPYALMVFAGMLPWTIFSSSLTDASNSLVSNTNLIGKVYFPRLIVPLATFGVAIADFLIGFGLLIVMMVGFQFTPGWRLALVPFFLCLALFASLGPSLLVSALNVKYRDFRFIVPFIVQFGIYVSPVGFSSNIVPESWRLLYSLNPMVGVIDGFRWSVLNGQNSLYLPGLILSIGVSSLFLWLGLSRFRAMERTFADLI
jgi:lipopolysaccharide transport system permease protein